VAGRVGQRRVPEHVVLGRGAAAGAEVDAGRRVGRDGLAGPQQVLRPGAQAGGRSPGAPGPA
jgi:hypothetical protein